MKSSKSNPENAFVPLKASLLLDTKSELGEGAFWDHLRQQLVWVDIEGRKLHTAGLGGVNMRTYTLPQRIGTVVPGPEGDFVVALEGGIYLLDRQSEVLSLFAEPEPDRPNNRMNDGKCDPAGRLWVGSMSMKNEGPVGGLYRLEGDGSSTQVLDSVRISNGIVWSLDERKMYYIDTGLGNVRAFDYDKTSGEITNERVIIDVPDTLGYPDGMTIDQEGMLWIALWNGHAVSRWDPERGKLLQTIEVPALNVTSCAFGGPDLDTLYITSARMASSTATLEKYPHAGGVFKVVPGVRGIKSYYFQVP